MKWQEHVYRQRKASTLTISLKDTTTERHSNRCTNKEITSYESLHPQTHTREVITITVHLLLQSCSGYIEETNMVHHISQSVCVNSPGCCGRAQQGCRLLVVVIAVLVTHL